MENQNPLVSIIMPSYNRASKLERSIHSVLNQSYQNWELLIVDDKSTDGTEAFVASIAKSDSRIKYLKNQRKKGPSGARNTGLLKSRGQYIAFLDSDDVFLPHHLKDSLKVLLEEDQKIVFSLWIQEQQGVLKKYDEQQGWREALKQSIKTLNLRVKENYIFFNRHFYEYNIHHPFHCYCICTMVFHRQILQNLDLFNEDIFGGEDTDFMYRAFHDFDFCLIDNHHFIYHQGQDNLFNFIDWGHLDIDDVLDNKDVLGKIIFSMEHEIQVRKLRHKQLRRSVKLINKKSCLKANRAILLEGYKILAYIYSQSHFFKQFYYSIKVLLLSFQSKTLLSFFKMQKSGKYRERSKPRFQSVQIRNDGHVKEKHRNKKRLLKTLS